MKAMPFTIHFGQKLVSDIYKILEAAGVLHYLLVFFCSIPAVKFLMNLSNRRCFKLRCQFSLEH